jgi:arginine-tRNA-protein transferase
MARLLQQFVQHLEPCPYLWDRDAALDMRLMLDVTPDELEVLLVRGWRRFGSSYFRPACRACGECVSIRIPTDRFAPSKSQRRARRACAHLLVEVGTPRVDAARLELYHRWHAAREEARGWEPSALDEEGYRAEFAFPHPSAREVAYYELAPGAPPKLVGVGLCDETPRAWSAAYFFYDPDYAKRSLGVANVVYQVELARSRGIPHVYLGYRVAPCPSMRYKATFRPHEILLTRPALHETPQWVPGE